MNGRLNLYLTDTREIRENLNPGTEETPVIRDRKRNPEARRAITVISANLQKNPRLETLGPTSDPTGDGESIENS